MIASVTCQSPINIALVKYWGKTDESLIIPANDSFSITINKQQLCSTTTVTLTENRETTLTLNGQPSALTKRITTLI